MILFESGPHTPPLHRRHPAVKELDRIIRHEQIPKYIVDRAVSTITIEHSAIEQRLQLVRRALVGKPLRNHFRTGRYSRQKRLL